MIYDAFLFNNELDLLELRVNELSDCIEPVTHILVESKFTFTGKPKPLVFADNSERFADFPIMSISVDNTIESDDPWEKERFQRNIISNALKMMCPADRSVVIVSDIDEIPHHKAVDSFCKRRSTENIDFAAFLMLKFGYYLNYKEAGGGWDRARIMTYKYLKDKAPEEVRNSGYENLLTGGGWHFSWMHDKAQEKLKSFSHTELDTGNNSLMIEGRMNFWNGVGMEEVSIDESFPEYLRNNISKFKHLIK